MIGMNNDGLLGRFDAFWEDKARIEYGFKVPEQWFLDEAEKMYPDGLRVLDLGCGNGRNAVPLARMGCKVTGVDISKVALSLLKEKSQKKGVCVDVVQS
ncbi:MAG TPA: class I SAM-dependent methyltransferase, partial [Caldisericia bacterium]|nr:class I SAM-dependent methyltransferase [Caldisericia bacterium]